MQGGVAVAAGTLRLCGKSGGRGAAGAAASGVAVALGGAPALARDNELADEAGGEVRWMLYAPDAATGRQRFEVLVHRGRPIGGRHRKNTYASETPATDGERIYVLVGNVGLFAYSLDKVRFPERLYRIQG